MQGTTGLARGVFAVMLAASAALAQAQDAYPTRPVRIVVPTTVGAGTDLVGRIIASQLGASLGQPVIIDNRPGAGGAIGATQVKNAAPDGYTVLLGNLGSIVTVPYLANPSPYDPVRDFDAVALIYRVPLTLVVNASVPAKNMRELIEYARQNPNKLNYSSSGPGAISHLWVELLRKQTGIQMVHVPYKGAAPALQAVLTGEAHMNVSDTSTMTGAAASPQVRVYATFGAQRASSLPDVPTIGEAGYRDLTAEFWFGVVAPKGTPSRVIARLNEQINAAMASAELNTKVATMGGEATRIGPEAFAAMIAKDAATWAPIAREIGAAAK